MKSNVDVFVSILQSGIDIRVLSNAVDINGKVEMNATSTDMCKIHKVDGSTLYDSFELSFNTVDNTSISKVNNIDILTSLNLKALDSDVYKRDIDSGLNLKADKLNTNVKYDVDVCLSIFQAGTHRRVPITVVDSDGKFKINGVSNAILKIQKVDGSTVYDALDSIIQYC